jgi:HPt (histidine-containing phosphotransfer) domain-containing protein
MLKKWLPPEKLRSLTVETARRDGETEKKEYLEFWDKINQIEGLHVSTGLERVDGQRDVYVKTLKLMIGEMEKCRLRLGAFLAENNMHDFRIEAHGIKGSLANIGAMDLAAKALELELASDKMDAGFCAANLPAFLNELDAFDAGLKEAFSSISQCEGSIEITPELSSIFDRLIAALDEMDFVRIDQVMEELNTTRLNGAIKEKIEQIRDAVMMMDYEHAGEIIREMTQGKR